MVNTKKHGIKMWFIVAIIIDMGILGVAIAILADAPAR